MAVIFSQTSWKYWVGLYSANTHRGILIKPKLLYSFVRCPPFVIKFLKKIIRFNLECVFSIVLCSICAGRLYCKHLMSQVAWCIVWYRVSIHVTVYWMTGNESITTDSCHRFRDPAVVKAIEKFKRNVKTQLGITQRGPLPIASLALI